jgi:hypothetical protein
MQRLQPTPAVSRNADDGDPGESEFDGGDEVEAIDGVFSVLKPAKPETISSEPDPAASPAELPLTDALPLAVPMGPTTGEPTSTDKGSAAPPPLSPEMQRLRERIRDVLAWHFARPERTSDRSPWGVMHAMLAFGVDSRIIDAQGRTQNAVGYLCYNNSARGLRLFHLNKGQIAAEIGPGRQGHEGQFLAMLAQSHVSLDYPVRIEGKEFKVRDLLAYEQATCEAGKELTFKLIAFSHYLAHDARWTNRRGESWDMPRVIREELRQPVIGAACGGTHRMMGFSHATRVHVRRGLPLEGQWKRAAEFRDDFHHFAFSLQNRDGSFSTEWFERREARPDPQRRLQTSGHILEWLVYSLPSEQLEDPRLLRGVHYVTNLLHEGRSVKWEIGPLGHALHALALYDERKFGGKPGERVAQLAQRPGAKASGRQK